MDKNHIEIREHIVTLNNKLDININRIDTKTDSMIAEYQESIDTKIYESEEKLNATIDVDDEKLNSRNEDLLSVVKENSNRSIISEILGNEEFSFDESHTSFDNDDDYYDREYDDCDTYNDDVTDMDDFEIFDIICDSENSFSFETIHEESRCDELDSFPEILDVTDEISERLSVESNSMGKHTVRDGYPMTAIQCKKREEFFERIINAKDVATTVAECDKMLPRMLWDPGVIIIINNDGNSFCDR